MKTIDTAAENRIEDAAWMAECGETLERAASRLGIALGTLEANLWRYNRSDIYARFKRNQGA